MNTRTLTYTPDGQIKSIRGNDKLIATYQYNHLRQRISKTTYDDKQNIKDTTQYFWDTGLLSAEIKDDKVIRRYVYLDIMPVAVLDYTYNQKGKLDKTQVYSIHTDHLGTPKAITNQNQETVWSIEMDTFGETKSIDSKNNFTFNLRFAGQYFDSETGYHYNYHRYYNPETGRYLTSDPIGLAGGLNSYGYAYNRPMAFVDPLGLYSAFMDKNFNLDNLWVLNNDIRTNQYYTHKFQPLMPPSYGATYIWIDGGLLDQHAALYLTSPKLGAFIYDPAGSALRNRYDSKGNYLGRYEIKLDDIHSHEVRTQDTIEIPHYSILEDYFKYHLENPKVNTSGKVKSVSLGLKLTKQEIDKLIGIISPYSNSRYSNVTAGLYCATTLRGLLRTNTITYKVLSSNNQLGFIDTPKSLYQDLKDINNGK